MKARALISRLLAIWGAFTLLFTVAAIGYVIYTFGVGNRTRIDSATIRDVQYVLNWCGLGADRIQAVTRSYVSSRNFNGDHLDAYAIKVSRLELSELTQPKESATGSWYRGDSIPSLVDEAYKFMGGRLYEVGWFPTEAELRTSNYYVYP
jgi:hypothetical protein